MILVLAMSIGDVAAAFMKPATVEEMICSGTPSCIHPALSNVCLVWS